MCMCFFRGGAPHAHGCLVAPIVDPPLRALSVRVPIMALEHVLVLRRQVPECKHGFGGDQFEYERRTRRTRRRDAPRF
jgi:hypothetical protein